MPTIHAPDPWSRKVAIAIANELAERQYKMRAKVGVEKPSGAPDELVLTAGVIAEKQKKSRYALAISLDVSRNGNRQRIRVANNITSRHLPSERDKLARLAGVAAFHLAPLLKKAPKSAAKTKHLIHVDAYFAQSQPQFRNRVVAQLKAQGFRTRVTLGVSETRPDQKCWGYLMLPFISLGEGKYALSPAVAIAGGNKAKARIRATGPNLSDASATTLLADKLVAWYGKIAAMTRS